MPWQGTALLFNNYLAADRFRPLTTPSALRFFLLDRWKTAFEIGHRPPENQGNRPSVGNVVGNGGFQEILLCVVHYAQLNIESGEIVLIFGSPKVHIIAKTGRRSPALATPVGRFLNISSSRPALNPPPHPHTTTQKTAVVQGTALLQITMVAHGKLRWRSPHSPLTREACQSLLACVTQITNLNIPQCQKIWSHHRCDQ
jgi:hypothetical protein